ncbi:MAG: TolC family outer membrane protein [Cellvibrionaceae bacterium]|nr:TolC family outer membrane protein [Cellvibrionaceae bacterium]
MKKLWPLLGTFITFQFYFSSTVSALSLTEVVRHVLVSNPEIQAVKQEEQARASEVRGAQAGYLPTLDAELGVGREWTKSPATNDESVNLTRKEAALRLRQLLYNGGATSGEVARQKARHLVSQLDVIATQETMALRTAEVYIDVMRQSELLTLLKDSLDEHQNIFDQMELRSQAGVGSRSDLDQIAARLALARSNYIAGENNLRDASSTFYGVVGYLPEVSTLTMPNVLLVPSSLEHALRVAYDNHPELKMAQADIKAAQAQYHTAKSPYYPRLTLEGDRTWNDDIDGVEGENEDFVIALRLRYNLYNGGADKSRRKQTASLLEEAGEIHHSTKRQVEESMRLSWFAYEATRQQLDYLTIYVDTVLATKEAYAKQFTIGKRSLLDLLNTENELLDARRNYLNARYDQLFSQYRIAHAEGNLISKLIIK